MNVTTSIRIVLNQKTLPTALAPTSSTIIHLLWASRPALSKLSFQAHEHWASTGVPLPYGNWLTHCTQETHISEHVSISRLYLPNSFNQHEDTRVQRPISSHMLLLGKCASADLSNPRNLSALSNERNTNAVAWNLTHCSRKSNMFRDRNISAAIKRPPKNYPPPKDKLY